MNGYLFVQALEKAGYTQAYDLVQFRLLAIAKREKVSLSEAAKKYIDSGGDEVKYTGTTYYNLRAALSKIPKKDLKRIDQTRGPGKKRNKKPLTL